MLRKSSRREPCPVCGRSKNSSCRWGEGVVYCFCGDDHHPPLHMRLGETLQISGVSWALVSTQGGFGGNSFVFRPHSGPPRPQLPRARQQRQHQGVQALMAQAMASVDAALAVPELVLSTPDELRAAWALIDTAVEQTSALQAALKLLSGQNPELRRYRDLLQEAGKELAYQRQDALNFRTHYLGEVKP